MPELVNPFEPEVRMLEKRMERSAPKPGGVLFYGSSSMVLWSDIPTRFAKFNPTNHGFGGSGINDCLHYFDRLVPPVKPAMIVLYAGDNDIACGRSAQDVYADVREFIRRTRSTLGDVPILYLSVKPSPSRFGLIDIARQANRLIHDQIARTPHTYFLDVFTLMLGSDGKPPLNLYIDDQLHMNAKGYAIWNREVGEIVEAVMG